MSNPISVYFTSFRWRILAVIGALLATWVLYQEPTRVRLLSLGNPYSYSGDALQHISPLWKIHDATLLAGDYISSYYVHAIMPVFYKWLYWALTFLTTPPLAAQIVTLTLSLLFIATCACTTWRLGGPVAGALSLVLAWGGLLKGFYCMGGLQRGFGVVFAALMLYGAGVGNVYLLGVLTILAAGLYPASAVLGLTALGLLLIIPARYRGDAQHWSLRKRLSVLCAISAFVVGVVTPQLVSGARYGERLSIESAEEFAEWGPSGRYTQGDRGVPIPLFEAAYTRTIAALSAEKSSRRASPGDTGGSGTDSNRAVCTYIIIVSGLCLALLTLRYRGSFSPFAVRVALFGFAMMVSFIAATIAFPLLYIPSRYVIVAVPCLVPVVFPWIWTATCSTVVSRCSRVVRVVAPLTLGLLCCALLGWGSLRVKPVRSAEGYRTLFAFIDRLPANSVIAGWPRGMIDEVSYFTGRSVLVFEEGHQIFHRDFLLEMRRRMRAVIDVYGAVDIKPFEVLRQDFNVTHLLIDRRHVERAPSYFSPFAEEIRALRQSRGNQPLYLMEAMQKAAVFRVGEMVLIDLAQLVAPRELK